MTSFPCSCEILTRKGKKGRCILAAHGQRIRFTIGDFYGTDWESFTDVESTMKRPGLVARLFGAKTQSVDSVMEAKLQQIRRWQSSHLDYSFRVYRTTACAVHPD